MRATLDKLGIPRATFYHWYDAFQRGGPEALADRPSRPSRVWNRLPAEVRDQSVALALEPPELSPRELAVRFTDERRYFVSEATVYRLLKAQDRITSPAYIVVKAADAFRDKTTAPNQLRQTDFTYLKVIGWGWYYLSTVLDDFSRYIGAWKLCATMQASDVTATLDLALAAAGLDHVQVAHRPRLLSDNGPSYVAGDLADGLGSRGMTHIRGAPRHPRTQGKIERWHQTLKNRILPEPADLPGELEARVAAFSRALQPCSRSREPGQPHPCRRLLRPRRGHPPRAGADQAPDPHGSPLAPSRAGCPTSHPGGPEPPCLSIANRLKSSDDGHG